MYQHCIFCHVHLGSNEVIERFPVGRRIAFDSRRGRLWVVCKRCERWNLSPIEERWEALEECERTFRDTVLRVSTQHIGLAHLSEGLDLIRIGSPLRPEFAGWRYGDQFGRRRRVYQMRAASGLLIGAAVASAIGPTVILAGSVFGMLAFMKSRTRFPTLRVVSNMGHTLVLPPLAMGHHVLRSGGRDDAWQLEVCHAHGTAVLTGPQAVQALSILMARLNLAGAPRREIRGAVSDIESVGEANRFISEVQRRGQQGASEAPALLPLPVRVRLALEMAANEDSERFVLEGELALLDRMWREAEEIAAVADDLLVSTSIRAKLQRFRKD